jgi:ribulose-phosphate 3-epimerase
VRNPPPVDCAAVARAPRIAPSILSADFAALAEAIDGVAPETDVLHVDVMDGHFVPNLTIGPPVVAAINRHTDLELDCHLMMTNPGEFLEAFQRAGADGCTVHVEIGGTEALIARMRDLGLRVGLAANPDTPFAKFEPYLGDVDLMLVMTVFPGFGGQEFIREVIPKVRQTAEALRQRNSQAILEVDGGIDDDTIALVAEAGAELFVAGKAVFGASDPGGATRHLRELAAAACAPA